MPVKKQSTTQRRRSTRIQHIEEEKQAEKKRINLKDLLKRSNSTAPRGSNVSSVEQDGDFVFKRTGNASGGISSSQSITERERGKNDKKRSRPSSKKESKPIRRLNPEDVTITPQRQPTSRKKSRKVTSRSKEDDEDRYEEHSTSFQIALPISDTPIIRRNQKFRKENEKSGIRRTSLGNRGKRVSSIGNGFSAVPHDKVPTNGFYKHLDSDLPDPHKMRQLLTWCSKRAFDEDNNKHRKKRNKLTTDQITALNIAKVIKEELVKDLSDGKINISWWNRSDDEDEQEKKINGKEDLNLAKELLPNEKNIKNKEALKGLKSKLETLQKESSNWEKHLTKKIDIPAITNDFPQEPPILDPEDETYKKIIDTSIISELSTLENQTFNEVNNNFEKKLDNFNDFIHKLKSSSSIRNRYTNLKSKKLANILDHTFDDDTIEFIKNNQNKEENVDTHHLLQGISRLDK